MAAGGGAESSSNGAGRERELMLSLAPHQQQQQHKEFPWAALLSQLQDSVSQVQGHLNQHIQGRLQRRNGRWQVGGWGRRERRQSERIALRGGRFAAIIPGDSVAETVISSGIFNFLNIYNTLLVVRLILTWFPDPPAVIANPLSTICDPYLNIFRGIIPPLGQIDLSPVLAFLALNVFTNAAAALPAELPSNRATAQSAPASPLTWRQRAQLKKGKMPLRAAEESNE
ncbi:unnamed protein product [Calypogeia fissa]